MAAHPLLELLQHLDGRVATVRKWSAFWADAHLVPVLRDARAALDQPDLTPARLTRYFHDLRTVLDKRDDTRGLADGIPQPVPVRGGRDVPDPADDVPLDGRIMNVFRQALDRLLVELPPPAPATSPAPPAGDNP